MQRRLFWICNLLPNKLWDKDYNIEDAEVNYDSIIFDCDTLVDFVDN